MAELTLNPGDIAAALKKNLEGFEPSLEARTVGRVAEVGDGIARVSGLPDAAVNELLEFEDGTVGLAPHLDERALDARAASPPPSTGARSAPWCSATPTTSRRARRLRPPAASCRCPSATVCSVAS